MFGPPADGYVRRRLVEWANAHDDVRAVILTSTRATDGGVDVFSDYDVIVAVYDVEPYSGDRGWLEEFGNVLVLYRDPVRVVEGGERCAFITQYDSGLKMDFTVMSTKALEHTVSRPELPAELDVGHAVLVDKDALTDGLAAATGTCYVPKPPSDVEYLTLIEVFLHEATYVAKHLWRDDLLPAKYNLDHAMKQRDLRTMLEWRMELDGEWTVATKAYGKGLKRKLPGDVWSRLERTYVGADPNENWEALFATIKLFRDVALEVGAALGFEYHEEMHARVIRYLEEVRDMAGRRMEDGVTDDAVAENETR